MSIDVNHFAKKKKRVWYVSRMVGIRAGARRAEERMPTIRGGGIILCRKLFFQQL